MFSVAIATPKTVGTSIAIMTTIASNRTIVASVDIYVYILLLLFNIIILLLKF